MKAMFADSVAEILDAMSERPSVGPNEAQALEQAASYFWANSDEIDEAFGLLDDEEEE